MIPLKARAPGADPPMADTKEDIPRHKRLSLFQRAFFNQYNYILLGSATLYALATQSWLPAIVGLGAETLWLVLGADSAAFRRWAARQDEKEARQQLEKDMAILEAGLRDHYRERYQALRDLVAEVGRLANENKGIETMLLRDEMAKLGQLLVSFLRMATMSQRLQSFLDENLGSDIERDIARAQRALRSEQDPRVQASYKQALALAQKRLKQHEQIENARKALVVQMDTLEKALGYLKSHIMGIGSRDELAKELDGLVLGVASVADLEAETDEALSSLRQPAAVTAATRR
jgi:hypothetical protein